MENKISYNNIVDIKTKLDNPKILNLFSYIYTQEKSKYTEDELFNQLPDTINKENIINTFCNCNLLTKSSIYYTKD